MTNRPLLASLALFAAAFLVAVGGIVSFQVTSARAAAPAPSVIGPAVGSRVKLDVQLSDANGQPTTLARIAGGRPLMIVLFRSAAWCPYCQRQLKGLGPVADAARAKGVRFVAISYDKPETLAAFGNKQGLTYPLYSDTGSKLIDAMALRDPQYPRDSFAYGVPYPATLLLDAKGRVKAKSVETDYKIRPTNADLIAMLGAV